MSPLVSRIPTIPIRLIEPRSVLDPRFRRTMDVPKLTPRGKDSTWKRAYPTWSPDALFPALLIGLAPLLSMAAHNPPASSVGKPDDNPNPPRLPSFLSLKSAPKCRPRASRVRPGPWRGPGLGHLIPTPDSCGGPSLVGFGVAIQRGPSSPDTAPPRIFPSHTHTHSRRARARASGRTNELGLAAIQVRARPGRHALTPLLPFGSVHKRAAGSALVPWCEEGSFFSCPIVSFDLCRIRLDFPSPPPPIFSQAPSNPSFGGKDTTPIMHSQAEVIESEHNGVGKVSHAAEKGQMATDQYAPSCLARGTRANPLTPSSTDTATP